MTQDEIIEMAKQAGISKDHAQGMTLFLKAFAKLVAKKVRFEAADDAWMELVKHGIGWELRKAVTDRIHVRDE